MRARALYIRLRDKEESARRNPKRGRDGHGFGEHLGGRCRCD